MKLLLSLMTSYPYIDLPFHPAGWIGWFAFLGLIIAGLFRWWDKNSQKSSWQMVMLVILILVTPFASLFFGIKFPEETLLPFPGLPVEQQPPVFMFFSTIPWVLAGGFLGPLPAVIVAFIGGLINALWETHSLFTPLEMAAMALLFSFAVRQRYRTGPFKLLRHPLLTSIILPFLFVIIFFITAILETVGGITVRFDYAISQIIPLSLANAGELFIGGLITEGLYLLKIKNWGRTEALKPSPSESSLPVRFINVSLLMIALTLIGLFIGDWMVAGKASKKMLEDNLSSISNVAAESLPYFMESGQNLILSLADETLLNGTTESITLNLKNKLRRLPFFNKLALFDQNGELIAVYPQDSSFDQKLSDEELAGVNYALKGVLIQSYTIAPTEKKNSAQIIFIAEIQDNFENASGVLVGYTDLLSNPITQPIVESLEIINDMDGEGIIVDENWVVIYHTNADLVLSQYYGQNLEEKTLGEEISSLGFRQYVYSQSVKGRPWKVVLTVPPKQAQDLAMMITGPLMIILFALAIATITVLWIFIRNLTNTLQKISDETSLITRGHLDHSLKVRTIDELGQFAEAFEQMRISLKDRLDELNSLLSVSQGVASHLQADQSLIPVLKASIKEEVVLARIVLYEKDLLGKESGMIKSYGDGILSEEYAYLDRQIYSLMKEQDMLAIPNTERLKRIKFQSNEKRPGSLLAISLRNENEYLGAFWIAFEGHHIFSDEEIQFYKALAVQASLAATNSRLYLEAEIGRQRLESVLESAPEPVLVFDENMRLQILNQAAMQISDFILSSEPGTHVSNVFGLPEFRKFLEQPFEERLISKEIGLPDGRVYYASAAQVRTNGHLMGKVCMLRDISYYKELDKIKSDFVSTVSHDLRSPLTLLRGYTTMLEMVGNLNEQQTNYVNKMINNIENMTRLVNNLLDLGRIDTGIGLKLGKASLSDIMDSVVSSLKPQADQKNITLDFETLLQSSLVLEADSELLKRTFYNLIENAIKYTSLGGQVSGVYKVNDGVLVVEIRDTGIGIAPIDLPHMFEKFYRSGNKKAHAQRGTGLGLAIVRSIAERHNGNVWVDSRLGKGSVFYFAIPLIQPEKKFTN